MTVKTLVESSYSGMFKLTPEEGSAFFVRKEYLPEGLFERIDVGLEFDESAIEAIADKALERKTGARGLRAIMEAVTLDLMYHIPSDESITRCEITKEDVEKNLAIEEKEEKALVEKIEQAS